MRVEVIVKEQSYGIVTVEVPDGADESVIDERVEEAYGNGEVYWHDENFEVVEWTEV